MTLSKQTHTPSNLSLMSMDALLDQDSATEGGTALSQSSNRNLDDTGLIRTFVNGFVQGQSLLLCNANLRTEPVCGSLQLLSKKEGIISTAKISEVNPNAVVKSSSTYWPLVHKALLDQSFFPLLDPKIHTRYEYQHRDIPSGYQVNCTTAKELWRFCWGQGHSSRYGIPTDFLIYGRGPLGNKENWYPIKGMDCLNGQLFVKMLGWETPFAPEDMVVWLRKITHNPQKSATPNHPVRPDLRAHLRRTIQ